MAGMPRSSSAATGPATRTGAISPSTRCRRRATARSTIIPAASPISLARRMRFIGDPRRRIEEDYLRILRFFRFHAAYGHDHPDADGLAACIAAARWPRSVVARTRANGVDEAPRRAARRANTCGDVACRFAAARSWRRALSRRLREHGKGRSGDRRRARSGAAGWAGLPLRLSKTPSGSRSGCG